jgi:hypothetical protein
MTTKHQETQQEKAYGQFLDEIWEVLSEPARTLIGEAESAAYAAHMVRSYCMQPEEYDEAMEKMRLAAARLTEREHELLAKLWRVALAAAASIDSEDYETIVRDRVNRSDLHWYYRAFSGMIEKTLDEKKLAELRKKNEKELAELRKKSAEQEPIDLADLPF